MRIEERTCKCAVCDTETICAGFKGRWLCETHWHAAREATPPFNVRLVRDEETRAEYGDIFIGMWKGPRSVYTEAEAAEVAARKNLENERTGNKERWEAVPGPSWIGERIAHPGYMNRRRAEVLAAHPELKR